MKDTQGCFLWIPFQMSMLGNDLWVWCRWAGQMEDVRSPWRLSEYFLMCLLPGPWVYKWQGTDRFDFSWDNAGSAKESLCKTRGGVLLSHRMSALNGWPLSNWLTSFGKAIFALSGRVEPSIWTLIAMEGEFNWLFPCSLWRTHKTICPNLWPC